MTEIVDWLLEEGRRSDDLGAIIDGLCRRFVAAGVPFEGRVGRRRMRAEAKRRASGCPRAASPDVGDGAAWQIGQ